MWCILGSNLYSSLFLSVHHRHWCLFRKDREKKYNSHSFYFSFNIKSSKKVDDFTVTWHKDLVCEMMDKFVYPIRKFVTSEIKLLHDNCCWGKHIESGNDNDVFILNINIFILIFRCGNLRRITPDTSITWRN